jgi:complement component 1 Q subcomponent-binding protein
LTKKHNNETIRITFSIDDINNEPMEEDEAYEDDQALEDEPLANQPETPQSAKGIRTAPEDQIEDAEAEDMSDAEMRDSFPAKITINITKEGKPGSLVVEGVTQYGSVTFEDFWYFEDGTLSHPKSFEADAKRTKVYAGPPFGSLDVELVELLERYLAERGVNETLAEFVTEYIEFKEAREYTRWLGSKLSRIQSSILNHLANTHTDVKTFFE